MQCYIIHRVLRRLVGNRVCVDLIRGIKLHGLVDVNSVGACNCNARFEWQEGKQWHMTAKFCPTSQWCIITFLHIYQCYVKIL